MDLPDGVTPEFAKSIVNRFIESAIMGGHLTKEEAANTPAMLQKLIALLANAEVQLIIDHRDRILEMAESHDEEGDEGWRALYYALFFEHTINGVIDATLQRKKQGAKVRKGLIRACNIRDKLTWVLELLDLPEFDKYHYKSIDDICEERNAFAHYKWTEPNPNLPAILSRAKEAVVYMTEYEARTIRQ